MFKPLFVVATLLLLAATPGECGIPAGDILSEANIGAKGTAELTARLTAATTTEKIKHYQSLTDVVEKLGKGIGLGDSCLAHHIYMTGPLGISKASKTGTNYATEAIKPANYSEPVIAGLLAVAKADVYALKQMVETSTKVLAGLALLQADDAADKTVAPKASNATVTGVTADQKTTYKAIATTMQTTIAIALKENIKNAMSTLAPVEEVIYALAQGNTDTNGLLKTDSADATAATKLNTDAATLAKDTSTMIEGYFAALKTIGVTDAATAKTELTGLTKTKLAATKATYGEVEKIDGDTFFTPADAYQKAFVAYVKALLPSGTDTLANLKLIAEANSVIGQVVATATTGNNGYAEAILLDPLRKAYVAAIGEKITDIASANGADAVICGRTNLADIIPGLAATSV